MTATRSGARGGSCEEGRLRRDDGEDGFEAMSLISDHRPDIIFVDIMMPRLDGYQTCQLIKNNKKFRDHAGDHAVEQGRRVRPCARPDRRIRSISTSRSPQEELIEVINEYVH
jgi:twitching motility two-component system response regulator PilG